MKELKTKIDEKLKSLDAELSAICETRDILTNRLHTMYSKPYEVVISFPASLGERGFKLSMYYNGIPEAEQIYTDFRKDLKVWTKDKKDKPASCGAYEDQAVKIGLKVLRSCIKK